MPISKGLRKIAVAIVLLSGICAGNYGYSQKIHSTAEILKIMSDSKLGYELKTLDKPVAITDYSEKLNHPDCYRVVNDSGIFSYSYKVNDLAEQKLQKAETYYQAKDYDNALLWYKSALEADSSCFFVMTYIGQMYEIKKDHENAIIWFKKAISKNYIDYMAHWFLADNYKSINDLNSAVDEIAIARILNRNNLRIKQSFNNIFLRAKRDTTDWYFNPQIEIKKLSDTIISVAVNDKWVGYGMAKALWMCEPGYSESMGVEKGKHSTLEDRECLISLVIAQINAKTKIKNDPQLFILKQAAQNNHL
ncbi:MAG TPA: tetratricopeptide repeat protein, partial [Paludibacter sp.]|nr:tetratricopeptide repeat protein [Paludibacter sp.]